MDLGLFEVARRKEVVEIPLVADLHRVLLAEGVRPGEQRVLDVVENAGNLRHERLPFQRGALGVRLVPTPEEHGVLLDLPGADLDPQRNPFFDPLPAPSPADLARVDLDDKTPAVVGPGSELPGQSIRVGHHRLAFVLLLEYRQQHDVGRGRARRHDDAVVIAVGHDHAADQPGGGAPRGGPGILLLLVGRLELDLGGAGEILPEKVGRPGLERLAVLHHGLDAQGIHRPGKALGSGLGALDDRHRQDLLRKPRINVEHQPGPL